jgi:transposase
MTRKRSKSTKARAAHVDTLSQMNLHAAGVDIGSSEIYVAVPPESDAETVCCFRTFTPDLEEIAKWLTKCEVTTVAMESTGVYWIPLYELLESKGFKVCLVNARHLKNTPGRKTDVLDCQWIQQLHTYGLLQASFRPSADICALRAIVRQRDMLVRDRGRHVQHMLKALQTMNIQLNLVLSDITGVTGMNIIRAIIDGEHDPKTLAAFRDGRCAHAQEEIEKALQGNYRQEHLFALRQAVQLYDFYGQQIEQCDDELETMYKGLQLPNGPDTTKNQPPAPKAKRRKSQANFDLSTSLYNMAGVDLTRIPGVDALTAQVVLSEIGTDMSKWETVKHFASWLGICPQNEITGGKVQSRSTARTDNPATNALRLAAQSVWHSDSAIGNFYRRIRAKDGPAVANTATAHKLARVIYHMLRYRVDYVGPEADVYETQYRDRAIRNLTQRAKRLGFRLEPKQQTVVT